MQKKTTQTDEEKKLMASIALYVKVGPPMIKSVILIFHRHKFIGEI